MNSRVVIVIVFCVVSVLCVEQKSENVRDKRTLHIVLKAFADSLGYDVQKRPPSPPKPLPKPAVGMSPANPPKAPPPPPMMAPKSPPPPPMMAPKAPPMMPAPKAPPMMPPMPAPKAPAPAPMPPPKPAKPAIMPTKVAPRLPTVPPLLTETIQKMFNINFNWNRNTQPAPAMPAKSPAPKAPPAPPAPAPKAPAPAPAPSQPPKAPAPSPSTGPVKHVLYSYDYEDGIAYPQNLKDYDNNYQYDNSDYQQPQQQAEEVKQSEEATHEVESQESDAQKIENSKDDQAEAFYDTVQNYWDNKQANQQQDESKIPQYHTQNGHSFVVNHPAGSSYFKMEHKKQEQPESKQYQNFGQPIYYYEDQPPPLESRNQKLEHPHQNYNFQGPSFNQYFYVLDNEEQQGDKANVDANSSEEKGVKQPAESQKKETISPEASFPIPAHNIYQENPFVQWLSPFEASSEMKENKVKVSQKMEQKQNAPKGNSNEDPYAFKYEPDSYSAHFSAHTIPPPTPYDYSQYEPAPFKLEEELSDKAQIKEEQFGRKYTTIHKDNLVHRTF